MNIVILFLVSIMLFGIYIIVRNEMVFSFRREINTIIFDKIRSKLLSYSNDDELKSDYENYQNYHDAMLKILYKNSYDKMVFSFKPLKYEYWFTDEEIKMLG